MGRDISSNKVKSTDNKSSFTRNTQVDYNEKQNERERSDDFFNVYRIKSIILLVFVIILYVIFFSILNNQSLNTPETKPWVLIIEVFLWVVLIVILVMNVRYFNDKDFNFNNTFKHLFDDDKKPELEVHVEKQMDVKPRVCKEEDGEVFHVGKNNYTYETAREVCDSYGSRLASYDEVEKAYMNGANWCSYGWSDGQMALFPIQKAVFNELKQVPGREHDCGRPGVNGGYIKDKDIKFGVNCYGKKPYATDKDVDYFKKHQYLPVTSEEVQKEKDKKVGKFLVSPFNKEKWSESL
jgi:hypothetical protein